MDNAEHPDRRDADGVGVEHDADRAAFKIGMPPGMETALDTVPSSDVPETRRPAASVPSQAPIPIRRPGFGLAPAVPPATAVPQQPEPTGTEPTGTEPVAPERGAPGLVDDVSVAAQPMAGQSGRSADEQPARTQPRLLLPDGGILPVSGGVIVGRDPQQQAGYGAQALATLHDVERSVSKTHAVIGETDGQVWVIDLNSTNGTTLVGRDGAEIDCQPEVMTPVPPGTDISFGQYLVRVALG